MSKSAVRFTYEDYLQLPEDKRYEILEGDLFMVPAPNILHQRASRNLTELLSPFVKEHDLGEILVAPVDVLLSDEDVVQPDLLFVSKSRSAIAKEQNIKGPPDLVIEILSPGTEKRDRTIKRKVYWKSGVRELWFVDAEAKTIEVQVTTEKGFSRKQVYSEGSILKSDMLPGLSLHVNKIFTS